MEYNAKKLSDYIDRLNMGESIEEDEHSTDSAELKELYHTARLVHRLKEPEMPGADFERKLTRAAIRASSQSKSTDDAAQTQSAHDDHKLNLVEAEKDPDPDQNSKQAVPKVETEIMQKTKTTLEEDQTKAKRSHRSRASWLIGMASIAAIFLFIMNIYLPSKSPNLVYAMEEAFHDIKVYHGVIEIVTMNAEGDSTSQAKLEVWADKEGRYYMNGLSGPTMNITTVNNGEMKWQIQPDQSVVHKFPAFPDAYVFIFDLANEIKDVRNALSTEVVGKDKIAGRDATILEVTPDGGSPYKIWIDQETHLPIQKQSAMHNAIQYKVTYTEIDFSHSIPEDLLTYRLPKNYKVVEASPEQIVNNVNEAAATVGFKPAAPETELPASYSLEAIAVIPDQELVKHYYRSPAGKTVIVAQSKINREFNPVPTAALGKINGSPAEIQAPIYEPVGILEGGGLYAGLTDVNSIRWQEEPFEFAIISDAELEDLEIFIKNITDDTVELPNPDESFLTMPTVKVPYDLTIEENDQKSVDAGSSPWRLDPKYSAQVFVSLKFLPGGITGEYPIDINDLEILQNTGNSAIVKINSANSSIKKVYLKRLIRQDSSGIWTVVGYD